MIIKATILLITALLPDGTIWSSTQRFTDNEKCQDGQKAFLLEARMAELPSSGFQFLCVNTQFNTKGKRPGA